MISHYHVITLKRKEDTNLKRNDLLTPEGTRDLLFDECVAKRYVQDKLTKLFSGYGYSEVMTPGLEFYDVFNGKVRYFPQETMYKLVDGKNRLMVLRPDNTMPIARLAATRLRDEPLPLKLFYNQSIFMVNPKNSGRDDEFTQSGIEILGGESRAADLEALVLAASSLSICDSESARLEIGESSIFRLLTDELGADDEQADMLQALIEAKNYPALSEALAGYNCAAAEALANLPKLFGGAEVFDKAEKYMITDALKQKLAALRGLYDGLTASGLDMIRVDLGLVHKRNYYTGIIFRGYMEGYGLSVLSGGRYDALTGDFGRSVPAVGFALNVEAAAKAFLKDSDKSLCVPPDVMVYAESGAELLALKHCAELIRSGKTAFNSLDASLDSAKQYAAAKRIPVIDIVSADGSVKSVEV